MGSLARNPPGVKRLQGVAANQTVAPRPWRGWGLKGPGTGQLRAVPWGTGAEGNRGARMNVRSRGLGSRARRAARMIGILDLMLQVLSSTVVRDSVPGWWDLCDAGIVAAGLGDKLGPGALSFAEELGIVVKRRGRRRKLGWREQHSQSGGAGGSVEIGSVRLGGQGETR